MNWVAPPAPGRLVAETAASPAFAGIFATTRPGPAGTAAGHLQRALGEAREVVEFADEPDPLLDPL